MSIDRDREVCGARQSSIALQCHHYLKHNLGRITPLDEQVSVHGSSGQDVWPRRLCGSGCDHMQAACLLPTLPDLSRIITLRLITLLSRACGMCVTVSMHGESVSQGGVRTTEYQLASCLD